MLEPFVIFKGRSGELMRLMHDVKTKLLERCRQEEKEYRDEIHLLQKYIEENNHAKKQLSSNYMHVTR